MVEHAKIAAAGQVRLTRFELRPRDGSPPVRGDLRVATGTTPRTAVVLCHGFKGFKDWGFFPALSRALARRGHAAVSFNFSRSGVGPDGVDFSALELFEENTHSRNVAEIHSVLDALGGDALLPEPPGAIGLFGHSRGGGEAVLAGAVDPRLRALVTWSAIATVERWTTEQIAAWERGEIVYIPNARTRQQMPMGPGYWEDVQRNRKRLHIARAASRLGVPWLIVHGAADESVSVDDAHTLAAAAGVAELLIVPDAGHTFGAVHPFAGPTPELETAARATLDWFDRHLTP